MYDTHLKQICKFELKILFFLFFFYKLHCLEATRGELDGFVCVLKISWLDLLHCCWYRFQLSASLSPVCQCWIGSSLLKTVNKTLLFWIFLWFIAGNSQTWVDGYLGSCDCMCFLSFWVLCFLSSRLTVCSFFLFLSSFCCLLIEQVEHLGRKLLAVPDE